MDNISSILNRYWGYSSFRPLQKEIIESVLSGKDTLALLPTGGGKSICFQVPALAMDGMCIVVSPLIALMKDQVEALHKKDIPAAAIYTGMPFPQVKDILQMCVNEKLKFLYVSPERLETKLFLEYLPGMNVQLIAVDEAHCVSQWGYDFRPSYLRIVQLRNELPGVPLLALTASATPLVQDDICKQLQFKNKQVFKGSFLRDNLSFSVFKVDSRINKIQQVLKNVNGSAIVYCKSRRMTQEVAQLLQLQNISTNYYHAGLTNDERSKRQESWLKNETRVMVCTNAFGMGIDKSDVRIVIHHDVPDCLENYYQEAGRAGRDGQKSYAVLLYEERDLAELQNLSAVRFPSIEEIKTVYQYLVNYLQLPSGSGEGQWFEFDLNDFMKTFHLNAYTAMYSLKALEQEGWMIYTEQVFLPAKVVFTSSKERLAEFEKEQPQLDLFVKGLLRSYGGIFDMECFISEKQLAAFIKAGLEEVRHGLMQLHRFGIIEYTPQKDKPQIQFLQNRPATEDLYINPQSRQQRKEQFEKRVKAMIDYVKDETICRSKTIGQYFGDEAIDDCGVCDVCLWKKGNEISAAEFEQIRQFVFDKAARDGFVLKTVLDKMGSKQREKVWKVVEHLIAEEKLQLNVEGKVFLRQ